MGWELLVKPKTQKPMNHYLGCYAAMFAAALTPVAAAVPVADVTLQPVITQNLPVFSSLTGYAYSNDADSVSTTFSDPGFPATVVNYDAPLFYPYSVETTAWWDNLVAEQLQGRLPVALMPTRGVYTLNSIDFTGPGNLNPRKISRYLSALQRAGAANQIKLACFVDSPSMREVYHHVYSYPSTTKFDLSDTAAWEDVVWQRMVKPWFDTVPASYWYRIDNRPVIQWWGFHPSWASNHYGNAKLMLDYVSDAFFAAYAVRPYFILPQDLITSSNQDPTSANQVDVLGLNGWFGPPSQSHTSVLFNHFVSGTAVPGFINPNYFRPSSSQYGNASQVIPHNGLAGTGQNGDTLVNALNELVDQRAEFTCLEGWNDVREWAGFYRAISSPRYDSPSQYINLLRKYTDPRTVTLRLEAEAADQFSDTSSGNSQGQVFRRSGNLDIRALSGVPSIIASSQNAPGQQAAYAFDGIMSTRWVTSANGPGWIQYDYGTNNQKTVTGYTLTSASDNPQKDPKDWQFQGSNNGTSWTTLDTRSGQTFATRLLAKSFTFSNTTPYRFHRLNITANSGGSTYGLHLQEISFNVSGETMGSGWVVTDTANGEWLQFDKVHFSSGNYRFPIRYSSASAGRQVRLLVDGVALPTVTLPSTGGSDVYDTISLGEKALAAGFHNLRVEVITGGFDLDWVFVKKFDNMISFKGSNGLFLCAEHGGDSTLIINRAAIGNWEKFSANDLNGGALSHNDTISIQAFNGLLMSAAAGGGGSVTVEKRNEGSYERFVIEKTNGTTGSISNGDTVAFRTSNGRYLTLGSGNLLDATGSSIGSAQTFVVNFYAQ